MPEVPNVTGYSVKKAIAILGNKKFSVEITSTPYEDKKLEREANEPVVVRQREEAGEIKLIAAKFK